MNQQKHCKLCGEDKMETEFYKNANGYISSKCKTCHKGFYRGKYKAREKLKSKYPQARCFECEELFQLDFDPVQEKSKIPKIWLCNQCKIKIYDTPMSNL